MHLKRLHRLYRKENRLWNPKAKKVCESRYVVFLENDINNSITKSVKEIQCLVHAVMGQSINRSWTVKMIFQNGKVPLTKIQVKTKPLQMHYLVVQVVLQDHLKKVTITGNWWEVKDALYTFADDILEEQRSVDEALNSTAKLQWKECLLAPTTKQGRIQTVTTDAAASVRF